jgi:hypothetical protein
LEFPASTPDAIPYRKVAALAARAVAPDGNHQLTPILFSVLVI